MTRSSRQGPVCGVVLIEALVALLIVAFGVVALGGLQATFTRSADLARQRGDALRIASREMEALRAYANLSGDTASFASIQESQTPLTTAESTVNAEFHFEAQVPADCDDCILKPVQIRVSWMDRSAGPGQSEPNQYVVLSSFIAAADPALGFVIRQAPEVSLRSVANRNPALPPGAKDLGTGSSADKPPGNAAIALVFNNLTGIVTSKCTVASSVAVSDLVATDLQNCVVVNGYLLSGVVRFSQDTPANSDAPSGPALPLSMRLWLTSPHHPLTPSYECFTDAPIVASVSQSLVRYDCIVHPNSDTPSIWSGTLDLADLPFTGPSPVRVCRYSADYDGDRVISNAEHPLQYQKVTGDLRNQNFLVVTGGNACPAGHAIDPALGFFRNTATVLHQDATTPSHAPSPTTGG